MTSLEFAEVDAEKVFIFGDNEVAISAAELSGRPAVFFSHRAALDETEDPTPIDVAKNGVVMIFDNAAGALAVVDMIREAVDMVAKKNGIDVKPLLANYRQRTAKAQGDRVSELLNHNTKQLEENRAQRRLIQRMRSKAQSVLEGMGPNGLDDEFSRMMLNELLAISEKQGTT